MVELSEDLDLPSGFAYRTPCELLPGDVLYVLFPAGVVSFVFEEHLRPMADPDSPLRGSLVLSSHGRRYPLRLDYAYLALRAAEAALPPDWLLAYYDVTPWAEPRKVTDA